MKILFINPPNEPFTDRSILIEPIDILNLASFVEMLGINVEILDMDYEQKEISKIENYYNYDYVIVVYDNHIPLHKDDSFKNLKFIGNFYKQKNIPTILVGKLGTYNPQIIKEIDFTACTIGGLNIEGTIKKILDGEKLENISNLAYNDGKNIIINKNDEKVFDINNLPIPNRNLMGKNKYIDIKSILTSRGCNNNCSFCPVRNYWGAWQGKAPEKVVQEIESLAKNKVEKIIFLDDNASCDSLRLQKISKLLIEKNIKVNLGLLSSINNYDYDTFKLMKQAGFIWVHLGIESGSQNVINRYNKKFNLENSKEIIKQLKELGYRVRVSIIFDLEPVTEENLNKTIDYLIQTTPHEIRLHYLVARKGSSLYVDLDDNCPQYIHQNNVVICGNKDLNLLEKKKQELIDKLSKLNYKIIKNTKEWAKFSKKCDKNFKFLSFCPSRYGLGW